MQGAISVKESKINGRGVFANKGFGRGEQILKLDDSRLVPDRGKLTPEQRTHEIDVFTGRDGRVRIVFMSSPGRYINHSCDPNVRTKTNMRSGVRNVIALKYIRRGEEITWDYALNSWEEWEVPAECTCGSSNCRKLIRGNFFTLPRDTQMKYLPLLDEPFKERFKEEIAAIKRESSRRPQ
ncbi:MAG: SET domain-containing protein-lysine N-methyltransferase [Thaumarchaeota archaeon]|nr:SET domain-containing protein-lysine N-methyltransferase [Nitrososphaerota archaeon]